MQPLAPLAMRLAFKQQPSLLFAPSRLNILQFGRTRRLSVPVSSSRAFARDSSNESFHAPSTNDAAMCIAESQSIVLPVKKRRPSRIIDTLNPERLNPRCFMDLSGFCVPRVFIMLPDQDSNEYLRLRYQWTGGRLSKSSRPSRIERFPAGTHGFLYFFSHPKNRLHSQIRFRVTEGSDVASFARGHDLLYDKGYVWHLPVASVAAHPSTDVLLRLLIHDQLIDSQLVSDVRNSGMPRTRLKRPIGSLDEPFVVDFAKHLHYISVPTQAAGQERHIMFALPQCSHVSTGSYVAKFYDEGSALCRLERSTLPEHAGRRVVVIRLLKILVPPKRIVNAPQEYEIPLPAEGELFGGTKPGTVWRRDLEKDTLMGRVLRDLYDGDEQDRDSHVG